MFIQKHPGILGVIKNTRKGIEVTGYPDAIVNDFRNEWFAVLGLPPPPRCSGPDPAFLEAWGRAVGDRDSAEILPQWLPHGPPIGILEPIETIGVFPAVEPGSDIRDPFTIHSELAGWTNYTSAEDEPAIVKGLLDTQERKGHCKFFGSLNGLLNYLQVDEVVLSKLALITKLKPDGTSKHRLIWDLLRSDVNASVDLRERFVLPRIQDAVDDALHLRRSGDSLEWLVVDISDAFHNIPLRSSERRFACAKVGDFYVVFEVLCMGGRSAPNIWGRNAACLGRLLASLFDPEQFRNEIYVDDPIMAAVGTLHDRDVTFTIALLSLQTTGFPLAWSKGMLGTFVTWIGAQLTTLPSSVEVSIPEDKLDNLQALTIDLRASTVSSRRLVRSYCGKLSFVAGMVPYIRPFLCMLWRALSTS